MAASGNGASPEKTPDPVATELRGRLEDRLGQEKTDAIWQDPTSVQDIVEGEAADVAEIVLKAWQNLPDDEAEPPAPRKRSRIRRVLRFALLVAVAVCAFSIMKRVRSSSELE